MITAAQLDWTDLAVCPEVDPAIFFPGKGEDVEPAKAICRSCPARVPCLELALATGDREGVYGGFTDRPRRRIARQHAAGRSLEDIIAADDARVYARLEKSQATALAAAARKRNRARELDRERAALRRAS